MKTISIKKIVLTNFKGIKSRVIDFGEETNIFGANGTGKTSIFDAFTWLLFGKDSTDRTNFEIKTLDENNQPIHKIDHEVEAVIDVDGEEINLRRTFREKWVKKRGALESEFGGNETLYFWNDVPMTLRDYTSKINDLVDESVFKLITSPTAFNSLKWQDQRKVLIDISGGVTDEDVAKGNPEFQKLLSKLTNKSLEEYQKQIASSIRKSKKDLDMIPTRIDEVERNKPEAVNFSAIEKELEGKKKELAGIENQISDRVAAQQEVLNKRSKIQKEIHKLETEIEDEKHKLKLAAKAEHQKLSSVSDDIQGKITAKNEDLTKAKRTLARIDGEIRDAKEEIDSLNEKNSIIRSQWNKRNAEEFKMDEGQCKCPTCNREFEAEDIEAKKKELFANFQNQKMKDLESLSAQGKRNNRTIEELEKEIKTLEERREKGLAIVDNLIADLEELTQALEADADNTEVKSEKDIYNDLYSDNKTIYAHVNKIAELKEDLQKEEAVNMDDLKSKKTAIDAQIEKLNDSLKIKEQIEKADERIASLGKEESQLAQQIADYEKDQFTIEQFTKAKIDRLEGLINDRFKFVNFKLFEQQVNGGEVPTCKALVNGVPFQDVNTAGRINAGLDIISTLCQHYGVQAPVFVDNAESVIELIPIESQVIRLVVSKGDEKLRVEAKELETELF